MTTVIETVDELAATRSLIDRADAAYYRLGGSEIMSNSEYDALKVRLRQLDPADERLTRVGVQYSPDELRTKCKHAFPLGSLTNTDGGIRGVAEWYEKVGQLIGRDRPAVVFSQKIDGASICAVYKNGRLQRVTTRGNGEVGDDITANAVLFKFLPTTLSRELNIDVRLEAVLPLAGFDKLCDSENIPLEERSNARNVGNGLMGRSDGRYSDLVECFAHNFEYTDGTVATGTYDEKLELLRSLGFEPVPYTVCADLAAVQTVYEQMAAIRPSLPYAIDGAVIILNELADQNKLITKDPKTRLRPKYAAAVKFPEQTNTTTLLDIVITVGHTGAIIPTAELESVRVGGVNVDSALLANYDEIKRLGLAIGDVVEVGLAGDIIPNIFRVVARPADRLEIKEPQHCPSCGGITTRECRGKRGAVTYCINKQCPAVLLAGIDHWIGTSKKGVGIMQIGGKVLKALWDHKLVEDAADLYMLTAAQIAPLKLDSGVSVGQSRAEKIVANIQAKRHLPLHTFLGSLGIELLGRRRVLEFVNAAGGALDRLEDWLDDAKLATLEFQGFGAMTRAAIRAGLNERRRLIKKLLANGVTIDYPDATPAVTSTAEAEPNAAPAQTGGVAGRSFCFTGTRKLVAETTAAGGIIKDRVSKGLDFLVQLDPTKRSNKTEQAEKFGTQIISLDFLQRVLAGEAQL